MDQGASPNDPAKHRDIVSHAPRGPSVFSIPPGTPFLPCLAARLMDGTLTGGIATPEQLARTTLYLPNRRAVSGLQDALLAEASSRGVSAALMPIISALSDVDEDALEFALPDAGSEALEALDPAWMAGAATLPLKPARGRLDRHLMLTRLIMRWGEQVGQSLFHPGTEVPLLLPKGPVDAARMALELSRLLDEFQVQGIQRDSLDGIVPDALAAYWALSREFLMIVLGWWEDDLNQSGELDPIARRNALISAQARFLETTRPEDPVIVAGSTGSVPVTTDLMKAIVNLPCGSLVLPGLDPMLDDAAWEMIGVPAAGQHGSAQEQGDPGHPQFGLKRLIDELGVSRADVRTLTLPGETKDQSGERPARGKLISEMFRPALATAAWPDALSAFGQLDDALDGVSVIEAENERLEALAIAVALREVLEDETSAQTAFLVTPDRMLARRVSTELQRWNITIDDSAGTPLTATAQGRMVMALADLIGSGVTGTTLLPVIRSGHFRLGQPGGKALEMVDAIELLALRSGRDGHGIDQLLAAYADGQHRLQAKGRMHPQTRRISAEALIHGQGALRTLAELLKSIGPSTGRQSDTDAELPFAQFLTAHLALIETVTANEDGAPLAFEGREGQRLRAELTRIAEAASAAPDMTALGYPEFLRALLTSISMTPETRNGQIAILGPLEARLLSADRVILGGVNEGSWPSDADTDPWLSRPMRIAAGLDVPERRIGLAAHDVSQAMGARDVILTRAQRVDGAPSVASRWLQRLDAVIGTERAANLRVRATPWLGAAQALDASGTPTPVPRPSPRPPVPARPRRLSVTEIETLIRDPYVIYGRHVLDVKPLDPIAGSVDHRLRGTIIHDALEGALADRDAPDVALAFMQAADNAISLHGLPPVAREIWQARLMRIADWLGEQENRDRAEIAERFLEVSGRLEIALTGGAFTLTVRADRIDILKGGLARIIDYKTGSPASRDQVHTMLAPQLPLEAWMLGAGGFADIGQAVVGTDADNLAYWTISGSDPAGDIKAVGGPELAAEAANMLTSLIAVYDDPGRG
jgi:ATP-dependent helicase/nuclease subunit B